jgi:hypothetical protein
LLKLERCKLSGVQFLGFDQFSECFRVLILVELSILFNCIGEFRKTAHLADGPIAHSMLMMLPEEDRWENDCKNSYCKPCYASLSSHGGVGGKVRVLITWKVMATLGVGGVGGFFLG